VKIVFLDQFSEPGGAQFCLRDVMAECLVRGWQPILIASGEGALVRWSQGVGVPTHPMPLGSYSNGRKTLSDCARFAIDVPRMSLAVRRVVERERPDLVYANGPRVLPSVTGLACPVVFHAHSCVHRWPERQIVRSSLRSAEATVFAASDYVAAAHESAYVIYNGVADLWRGARSFDRTTARVGFMGRIAREKGLIDFVQAARRLAESGADVEFLVYGDTLFSDPRYEQEVQATAEGAPVTFCGWTDDVARALRDLEILAVPSGPDEAATRVIMESFSAGTPVVAYPAGGIPELVEHERTGLLTETSDNYALARSIGILLEDRRLMDRLSAAGRQEWKQRFRVERFRRSVCDLLEQCAQSATARRHEAWAPARGHDEAAASR